MLLSCYFVLFEVKRKAQSRCLLVLCEVKDAGSKTRENKKLDIASLLLTWDFSHPARSSNLDPFSGQWIVTPQNGPACSIGLY